MQEEVAEDGEEAGRKIPKWAFKPRSPPNAARRGGGDEDRSIHAARIARPYD